VLKDGRMTSGSWLAGTGWSNAGLPAVSAVAFGVGIFLAAHHPLSPLAATALFVGWVAIAARHSTLWLLVVPAALPLANLSPWTGWIAFEEFDLLVLGTVAGGLAARFLDALSDRAAITPTAPGRWMRIGVGAAFGSGVLCLVGLVRGIVDAGPEAPGWFDAYPQASNSIRVAKSLLYAWALWPLLRHAFERYRARAFRYLASGMQIGLAIVGLAALAERIAYPGLLDFSSDYRTTALFWEMHVGGAAIDAYLALATPFAAWALWTARSRLRWMLAALLALLTIHACLTTFSRGVYLGVAAPLAVLAIVAWWRRHRAASAAPGPGPLWLISAAAAAAALLGTGFALFGLAGLAAAAAAAVVVLLVLGRHMPNLRWRQVAGLAFSVALMSEVIAVVWGGAFMLSRIGTSERDLTTRALHWRHGLDLMRGSTDRLFGIGLGRLPARYAQSVPGGEFSGALRTTATPASARVARLSGPPTLQELGGLYSMSQRVSLGPPGPYRLGLQMRTQEPLSLGVELCEQHLLYERQCQRKVLHVMPGDGAWQKVAASLDGPSLSRGPWFAPRTGVLLLSAIDAGSVVDLADVSLVAPDAKERLVNRSFSADLSHWLPIAREYFEPWHIDNLFLEVLIERGVLGLVLFVALLAASLRAVMQVRDPETRIAPFLAASLFGAVLVGSVSSILDVPRVAFLFLLLLFVALQLLRSCHPEPAAVLHDPWSRS
jgi:hypothetical protein